MGRQINVQITRINEATNDLILSEREAWVSFSDTFPLLFLLLLFDVFFAFFGTDSHGRKRRPADFTINVAGNVTS